MMKRSTRPIALLAAPAVALTGLVFSQVPVLTKDTQSGALPIEPPPTQPFQVGEKVSTLLEQYCFSCHDADTQRGKIQLDNLDSLSLNARLDLLNQVQDQMFYGMMPPKKKDQPNVQEAKVLADWVRGELLAHNASKLDDHLPYPDAGNYVDHKRLFDGSNTEKAYTPARRWLVSPQIFRERVLDVLQLQGHGRGGHELYGFANPFVLPDHAGVRYYDLTRLDGSHLLVMLSNAEWIATKQLQAARLKVGDPKAGSDDPRDQWHPETPPAFEAIIAKKDAPTDAELEAAVQTQFGLVLRRPATDSELTEYLAQTRSAMKIAGNTEGLRQMLKDLLLESEFVYRLEFGAGEPDAAGRVPLAPREAAYAIAYALGDSGPDTQLLKSAESGNLTTKADYEREVRRLLADENQFRGPVDPILNAMDIQSHVTSHPKLVRFFREFFGYPGAMKVFKDRHRSGGYYMAASDLGHLGTMGWLVHEADEFVAWQVTQDKRVFERLLTSDEYFVYHNMDTTSGKTLISNFKNVYDTLKDTPWKTKPEEVLAEHQQLLLDASIINKDNNKPGHIESLRRHMYWFQDTFGQGRTPFTRAPFSHNYYHDHSTFYSLPPTPKRERYWNTETTGFKFPEDSPAYWDYPVEQPFRIADRKGILTHPAWLIAFSVNSATDPIRRGRWIREKLLAGVVPDLPIAVDAKIPEDPHKSLRQRVASVTETASCIKCHSRMNDLGYAFEQFDDFGRFRTAEQLEHPDNLIKAGDGETTADVYKTIPIDTTGALTGSGDPNLDGPVKDSFEMIDRLAKSERVRQSIIRHAFRFFLGRNELPSDSQTLIDADNAYLNSGGSFRAVVVSLLTSNSFIYRKKSNN